MMPEYIVYPHYATVIAATCATIFIVLGVIGNIITIVALLKCQRLRKHATTIFVLSLCFSDLLFCSINLPLTASRFINKAWTFGNALCKVFPVIFYGNVAVSVLSMVGITLNRYTLIAFPKSYPKIYKTTFVWLQLILIWSFSFAIMIMPLLEIWGQLGLDEATFSCTILPKDGKSPKKFVFLVGFVFPCLMIILSYTCIFCTVRKQRKKMDMFNTSSYKPKTSRNREDSRLTIIMLTIFVCFLLCFLPLMIVNVFDDNMTIPTLHVCASILCWASAVINPFIYAVGSQNYRNAYINLFKHINNSWGNGKSIAQRPNNLSRNENTTGATPAMIPKINNNPSFA